MAWQAQHMYKRLQNEHFSVINVQDGKADRDSESSVWKEQCKKKYIHMKKCFMHRKQCCTETGDAPGVGLQK